MRLLTADYRVRFLILVTLIWFTLPLAGCGQKGDLYQPKSAQDPSGESAFYGQELPKTLLIANKYL